MKTRLRARAGAAAALAALLVALPATLPAYAQGEAASATAAAIALAREACAGSPAAPASTPAPASELPFPDLLRSDPATGLAHACAGLDGRAGSATPVAEALTARHRLDEAQRLLDALRRWVESTPVTGDEAARVHAASGTLAIETGANAAATAHFERALAALQAGSATGTRRHAQVLVGLAHGWVNARAPGDLERADAVLVQVGEILGAVGLAVSRDMSDVLNLRAVIAYARQDLPGTVEWARAELEMYRRLGLGDDPEQLHTLTTIGSVLSQLGRFDEAEAAFREGLRIIALQPDAEPAGQLGILNNLATLWRDRGRHDAALEIAERAVALATRVYGAQGIRLLTPLTVRGQAEWALARYAPARRSFEAALAIADRHRTSVGALRLLRLHDGLAAAQQALGDLDAARATLDDALRTIASGDGHLGYWRGRVLRSSAGQAARAGAWARADAQYAQAMALIAPVIGAEQPFVIAMLAERCVAQTRGAPPGDACALLTDRLERLNDAAPAMRFGAHAALALAADAAGRSAEARERHLQALAAAVSAGGPDPLWSAWDALAGHLRASGERRLAVLAAKQAVEQVERMRGDLGAETRRYERGFLANKLGVYRRLADWLTDDGRIDEALQVLRLLKQEEFNDYVRGAGEAPPAAAPRLETDRETRLRRELERLAPAGAVPGGAPAPDVLSAAEQAAQRAAWADQAQREAARVAAWRDFLAAHGGDDRAAAARASRAPLPATAGPGHGVPGELRVWAYAGAAHLNLVLEGPRQREVQRLPVDPQALAREVGRLLAAIGQRDDVREPLQALHAQIGRPIWQRARRDGARRLVLHLDGVLRYLPFAALHDGQRYLGERLAIEQRLVAGTGHATAPADAATMLRAVGVTRALGGLAPLGGLAREVCGIVDGPVHGLDADDPACADGGRRGHGLLPGAAWLNAAFTAERLALAAADGQPGRRDLLHVGTHFVLRPGNMSRSWLLLGDGERLHLDALARMSFAGQDLVTLSACETGIGGIGGSGATDDGASAGQEVDSLNGLVMRRGAGAVLASLWRVEDDSTSGLMLALYRELGRRTDPAFALQRAQAAVRESAGGRRAHPFHWAGFYLASGER